MACSDQISTQDLENAKTDATTLGEVATSRAGAVSSGDAITESTNRFGEVTDTIQGRLNKLGVIYSDPIKDWTASSVVSQLEAYRYPATTGNIYIPIAPLPFTTGAAFNTDNWVLYNGTNDDQIEQVIDNTVPDLMISDISQAYEFETEEEYKSFTTAFPVGKIIHIKDRDATYISMLTADTADGSDDYSLTITSTANPTDSIVYTGNITLAKAWGIEGDSTDDMTTGITSALAYKGQKSALTLEEGTYYVDSIPYDMNTFKGAGSNTILTPYDDATVIMTANETIASRWTFNEISGLSFIGDVALKTQDGFVFSEDSNNYTGKTTFSYVDFYGLNHGIKKEKGNIGNHYNRSSFTGCNFGIYMSSDTTGGLMHAGTDSTNACQFSAIRKAAVYITDNTDGAGGVTFNQDVFQFNHGYGILVNGFSANLPSPPITLNQVWLEGSGRDNDYEEIDVDGYIGIPNDCTFIDAAVVALNGTYIKSMRLVNTTVIASGCRQDQSTGYYDVEVDDNSAMVIHDFYGNQTTSVHEFIQNYSHVVPWAATNIGGQYMAHRCVVTAQGYGFTASEPFNSGSTYSWTGTNSRASNPVSDGLIYDSCTELEVLAGETMLSPDSARADIVADKWNVLTLASKVVSADDISDLNIRQSAGGSDSINYVGGADTERRKLNQWITSVALIDCTDRVYSPNLRIYLVNNGASTVTVRFADWQMMAFDTKQDALNYIDSREYQV